MDKDQFKGTWNEIKGKVKEQFGKLTDDDLTMIQGKRDQLIGFIQKRYGCSKEQAEADLGNFEKRLSKVFDLGQKDTAYDVPRKTGTEGR